MRTGTICHVFSPEQIIDTKYSMNERIIIQLSDFTTGCKCLYPEIRELLTEDDGFEELVLDDSTICVLK